MHTVCYHKSQVSNASQIPVVGLSASSTGAGQGKEVLGTVGAAPSMRVELVVGGGGGLAQVR